MSGAQSSLTCQLQEQWFCTISCHLLFITSLYCINPEAAGETPPLDPIFPWEKPSKLIDWRYEDTNQPSVSSEWKLLPKCGFGPSSGCSVLVLDLAQLLNLEFDIFRSYLKQESSWEPSKIKELSMVLCFPQVEVSVLAWFRDGHGLCWELSSAERGINHQGVPETNWVEEEAAEQKFTGDTRKKEFPAWGVGRIRLRYLRYVTDHSLSTVLGELFVRLTSSLSRNATLPSWDGLSILCVCALLLKVYQEYLCSLHRWTKEGELCKEEIGEALRKFERRVETSLERGRHWL